MSFKCKLGLHDWSYDCNICSRCGLTRDINHDWSKDCEQCSKCRVIGDNYPDKKKINGSWTRVNLHDWSKDCVKCSKCGKTRLKQHDWSKDCEKCLECDKTRINEHDWSKDCEKCIKCNTKRSNQHDLIGCKCTKCGQEIHDIKGCLCTKCGVIQHDWSENCEKCFVCGEKRIYQHIWEGCKCTSCSTTRDKGHIFTNFVCVNCGELDNIAYLFSSPKTSKYNSIGLFSSLRDFETGILIVELVNGANSNSQLDDGSTALEVAAGFGFLNGVDALLQAGADPNNWNNHPPLNSLLNAHILKKNKKSYIEKLLVKMLERGANQKTKSTYTGSKDTAGGALYSKFYESLTGRSVLYQTIELGYLQVVNLLLKEGESPNIHHDIYGTVLHWAVAQNWYEIVQLLVEYGADLEANKRGMLPIDYAKSDLMRDLLTKGTKI